MENSLTQLGLLSVVIQALGKGTFKLAVDVLTDHLSAFLTHAQRGPLSELFQKDVVKNVINQLITQCVDSMRRLKVGHVTLRPLRIYLSEWHPPYVVSILHCIFA